MRDTWYVLENGSVADPREVSPNAAGRLVHSSGVLVAMRGDVPSSRGVDVEEERAKAIKAGEMTANEVRKKQSLEPLPVAAKEYEARPARGYNHREMKRGR